MRLRSWRRSRLSALAFVLLAAGALVALLPGRASAAAHGHRGCATDATAIAQHHVPTMAHHAGDAAVPGGPSLDTSPQCEHCPTPACAMTSHCGGTSNEMGHVMIALVPLTSSAAVEGTTARPDSRSFQPPTPPPNGLL